MLWNNQNVIILVIPASLQRVFPQSHFLLNNRIDQSRSETSTAM
jgi:hypothetical protein